MKPYKTYLKTSNKVDTSFIQSIFSGLNLLNHHTHKGTVFIDDLEEVFQEPAFPAGVRKILFTSWATIRHDLLDGRS